MTFPSSSSKLPHNSQHPNNNASQAHSSTIDIDIDARAAAAVRRLADGQSDPHLAAAIARLLPRPPGRPKATHTTTAARRNAILLQVRRLPAYADLSDVRAAEAIHRDFTRWARFRDPEAPQPHASPAAQWFELQALGVQSMPKIKTIRNAFASH